MEYYDGTRILSMADLNGDRPEIYIITGNRSAGKTTYFNRYCVNRFIREGEKFCILYRYAYELKECANKFFKDIHDIYFPAFSMESKPKAKEIYHELYLNENHCGYAIALNSAEQIKKMSHLFKDVDRILFDEFQSETNRYCADEIKKFLSIHKSIARGDKKQVRYVPVIMISNTVSLLNPYYSAMGISAKIKHNTKILRGNGYVLEQCNVESAREAILNSGVSRAFEGHSYITGSAESLYTNDNYAFVVPKKDSGTSRYYCTLCYMDKNYAIREYPEMGYLYVDKNYDKTYPVKITTTTQDMRPNYVMVKKNDVLLNTLRWYFEKGCFRFSDIEAKEAVINSLSYK